jgi:hypothetical protein
MKKQLPNSPLHSLSPDISNKVRYIYNILRYVIGCNLEQFEVEFMRVKDPELLFQIYLTVIQDWIALNRKNKDQKKNYQMALDKARKSREKEN